MPPCGGLQPCRKRALESPDLEFDMAPESSPLSPGPTSAMGVFGWAHQFLELLSVRGKNLFGVDLSQEVRNFMMTGITLCTEYSGMGGPEACMQEITQATNTPAECVVCHHASDIEPTCRQVLLAHHQSGCSPGCVFGDILERCEAHKVQKLQWLAARLRANAAAATERGMPKPKAMRKYGAEFLQRADQLMWSDVQQIQQRGRSFKQAHCYRHDQHCAVYPLRRGNASIILMIAGITCTAWSSMGKEDGWLGPSAIAFVVFIREVLLNSPDCVILENTANFDVAGLAPLQSMYTILVLKFSPTLLGVPATRMRKYMVLIKRCKLQWRPELERFGLQIAFQKLFERKIMIGAVDLLRASKEDVQAYKNTFLQRSHLPALRASGREWSFFQSLPGGMRGMIRNHEACAAQTEKAEPTEQTGRKALIATIGQSPARNPPRECCPALLRKTKLWSLLDRRLCLPGEHLELMGYNIYGPGAVSFAEELISMKPQAQVELAGNGMHACAIGSVLLFLLCGVIERPVE